MEKSKDEFEGGLMELKLQLMAGRKFSSAIAKKRIKMINIEEHLSTLLEKANSEYTAITSKIRLKAVKEVACTSEIYSFLPY